MQNLCIEKLSGTFGGSIRNFSLASLSTADFEQVAQALWEHQVLVFKEQSLSAEDHLALGKRFGPLHMHPTSKTNGAVEHPEVLVIRSSGKDKNITEVWHTDVSCDETPPSISILQAVELPPFGGDTMWANQYEALDRLSPALREMITPLRAVHSNFGLEASHPVVRTHPESGREALYVNSGFTKHFEGMTPAESKPLLDYLCAVGSGPDLTMRHRWSVGDVVMWDNRCVMHYAIHDYDDMPREMHRVTVSGERPA